jgi:hypothetical protein
VDWKARSASTESTSSAASVQFPVHIEIVSGELSAAVHLHTIETNRGKTACWSYVTAGLARHGQREMIFTLVRQSGEPSENCPRAARVLSDAT